LREREVSLTQSVFSGRLNKQRTPPAGAEHFDSSGQHEYPGESKAAGGFSEFEEDCERLPIELRKMSTAASKRLNVPAT
jgi:hypothetical protein